MQAAPSQHADSGNGKLNLPERRPEELQQGARRSVAGAEAAAGAAAAAAAAAATGVLRAPQPRPQRQRQAHGEDMDSTPAS
jgi:hypothetical protein